MAKADRVKITDAWAKTAPPGSYQDEKQPALWLYVTATARTWGFYKWSQKLRQPVRKSLGPLHDRGVEAARKEADKLIAKMHNGEDINRPASADITLKEVVTGYTSKLRGEGRKHPTWLEKVVENHFRPWMNKPFSTITKAALAERHQQIAGDPKRGKMAASRAIHAMRALYKYAEEMDLYSGQNLAKSIKVAQQQVRDRVLTPIEAERIIATLESPQYSTTWVGPYFKLLMLTGARRSNVAGMRWKDIDLEGASWTIPAADAKAGKSITIPLMPEAVQLLKARKKKVGGDFVFPSPKAKSGHIVEPHFKWKEVLETAGTDTAITIHDIRRTFGARLNESGTPLSIIAKAMGHQNPATTARHYTPVSQEAVREAMAKVLMR